MTAAFDSREVCRLASAALDGVAGEEELAQLETILTGNSDAREIYYCIADLHANLAWELGNAGEAARFDQFSSPSAASGIMAAAASCSRARSYLSALSAHVPGGDFVLGTLVVLVVVAAFWGLVNAFYNRQEPGESHPAFISASADAEWSPAAAPAEISAVAPDRAIATGKLLELQNGTVELHLKQGAVLLVEGPAKWTIDDANSATLHVGKLMAHVPPRAVGFTLNTPTAQIIDRGTEFVVLIEDQKQTRVQVTRGSVDVRRATTAGVAGPVRQLRTGDTVRINATSPEIVTVVDAEPMSIRLPDRPPAGDLELRLSDILCGGDGLGTKTSQGLEPDTGAVASQVRSVPIRGDDRYHRVTALPFVDGIFIPRGGHGAVVVDSAGHQFRDFPPTQKFSHANLWVQNDGAISLHANKGFTIDLYTLGQHHAAVPVRFVASVYNTEPTPADRPPKYIADAWVLVDGNPRFAAIRLRGAHGVNEIDIRLSPEDRFLTLVATDADGSLGNDGIRFPSATLILASTRRGEKKAVGEQTFSTP